MDLLIRAIKCSIEAGKAIIDVYNNEKIEVDYKKDNSPLTLADKLSHNIIEQELLQTDIKILSEEGKEIPYKERLSWKEYWLIDPLDGTKEFINRNGEFTVNIALIKNKTPILGVIYVPVTKALYFASETIGSYKVQITDNFKLPKAIEKLISISHKLPLSHCDKYKVVASKSHLSAETKDFIDKLSETHPDIEMISKGSSLKLCMIAEGNADLYPRFGPTMEWDIAAGHAIISHAGGLLLKYPEMTQIEYNKEELLNPYFIGISKNNKFEIKM